MSQHTTSAQPGMSFSEKLRLYAAIAVGVVLLIFFVQNLHDVELKFLWMDWETNMFWALLLSAIFGALITLGLATVRGRSDVHGQTKSGAQSSG